MQFDFLALLVVRGSEGFLPMPPSWLELLYSIISVSIMITSVLNSASDRLAISSLLRHFPGVLIFSFI